MRAAVFYISRTDSHGGTPIHFDGATVYVRGEIKPGDDLSDVLDQADPRDGENVMNSHYIEGA